MPAFRVYANFIASPMFAMATFAQQSVCDRFLCAPEAGMRVKDKINKSTIFLGLLFVKLNEVALCTYRRETLNKIKKQITIIKYSVR